MVKVTDRNNQNSVNVTPTPQVVTAKTPQRQAELNVSVKGDLDNKERSLSSLKDENRREEEYTLNGGNQNTANISVNEESIENKNGYVSANNGANFATGTNINLSLSVMPERPGRISIALDMIRRSTERYITEHGVRDLAVSLPNK